MIDSQGNNFQQKKIHYLPESMSLCGNITSFITILMKFIDKYVGNFMSKRQVYTLLAVGDSSIFIFFKSVIQSINFHTSLEICWLFFLNLLTPGILQATSFYIDKYI